MTYRTVADIRRDYDLSNRVAACVAVDDEYSPGNAEDVITDGMILSAVQAIAAAASDASGLD